MFQRSFTADDNIDEAVLMEAANDWEDTPPENTYEQHHGSVAQSPRKKSIKEFFSR